MKTIIRILLLLLTATSTFASVPLAPRMGAGGKLDMYGCMQSNDYYIANFAAYPITQQSTDKKTLIIPQCVDSPYTGNTQISIDLLDRDVRRKPVWIKVFDNHQALIAQTDPAVAKQGVITTAVNFPHQGQYDVVLYVEDNELNTNPEASALHIQLKIAMTTAGAPASAGGFLTVAIGIVLLALILGFLIPRQLKPKKSAI
ncbi:MAG: hypothetical protein NTW85_14615 [Methylococcales bacterium]|nr:hypothetical protein [Methylococcales bacterium]